MANAILIPGKEKRVYGGHPWVFRSDIARVEGDFTPGDIVSVYSSKGKFLAKAFYNPQSQISLRIMSLHDEPIDRAFIFRRVKEAVDYRRTFADLRSCRLIFAESDRLPALIVDSFGDVPILDCLPDDDEAVERMPRRQVAEFIESELKACLPSLTKNCNAATYGKPTYWMAEALLVKLYINWAVYIADNVADYDAATSRNAKLDECVRLCDDIMQNGPFDLSDSYRKKFLYNNGPQIKDFIYAMPYDKVNATGMLYGRYRTFRKVDNGDTMGYLGGKMNKSCAGIFALNEEYSNLFTLKGDDRNEIILGATTDGKVYIHDALTGEATIQPYMYKGSQLVLSKKINLKDDSETSRQQINCGANATGWSQGYRSLKFYPNPNEYSEYNRNQSNDVPIFRFADIVLTKAEALLRGARATNADTPESLLNQIRAYVHAAKFVGTPKLQDILDERGREFVDENWRRNDMIRFGTFESEYGFHLKGFPGARFDKSCRILPVPKAIMDENQNWEQNEGYK